MLWTIYFPTYTLTLGRCSSTCDFVDRWHAGGSGVTPPAMRAVATITSHAYADDTQLYISVPAASCQEAIERFAGCLERVRDWMASIA